MTTKHLGSEGIEQFIGVVADVLDPHQLGRVRVRIFGIHDDTDNIADEDLPWATVVMPPTSASLSGKGISPTGLLPDSYVIGFFLDGAEKQLPFITGTFHKMPDMDPDFNDVNILARGTNKIQRSIVGPEPESPYKAQYPKNTVYESRSGHIIEIDDTDGEERINIHHRSGTYIEIDKSGKIVMKSVDSSIDVSSAKKTIYAVGDILIDSQANISINAKENVNISGKNVSIQASNTSLTMNDAVFGISAKNTKVSGDFVKIDTPISSISGTTIASGTISTSSILAGSVTSKGVISQTTASLSSGLVDLSSSVKDVGDLSSITTIEQLTEKLETTFGGLANNLNSVATAVSDSTNIKVDGIINQIDNVQESINSAVSGLTSSGTVIRPPGNASPLPSIETNNEEPTATSKAITPLRQYRKKDCIGVQIGTSVLVYLDKNKDGIGDKSELISMGPAQNEFGFADGNAIWNGSSFVSAYVE